MFTQRPLDEPLGAPRATASYAVGLLLLAFVWPVALGWFGGQYSLGEGRRAQTEWIFTAMMALNLGWLCFLVVTKKRYYWRIYNLHIFWSWISYMVAWELARNMGDLFSAAALGIILALFCALLGNAVIWINWAATEQ
jgi:hypothetical protein